MDHWDVKVGIISRCCLFCYCKQPEDTIWSPRYKLKLGEWRMKPPQIFSPYFPTTGSHTSSTDKPWAAVRTMLTETRQTLTNIIGLSSWFCRTFLVHREGFIFLYSAVARKHLWGRGRRTVCVWYSKNMGRGSTEIGSSCCSTCPISADMFGAV